MKLLGFCALLVWGFGTAAAQNAADPLYRAPTLGISAIDVDGSDWERDLRNAGITNGAILTRAEGPAKSAGLRKGDVLMTMGGVKVNDTTDVYQQLGTVWVDDTIEIVAWRQGTTSTYSVTASEAETDLHAGVLEDYYTNYYQLDGRPKAFIINWSRNQSWIMGPDDSMASLLQDCAQHTGERCFVMHLVDRGGNAYWLYRPQFFYR